MNKSPKITLTNLPLSQFVPGQGLMVRFNISSGHSINCEAEFISIERGLVKVKITRVESPSWFEYKHDIPKKYPNYIGRFRASNCYLWGQSGKIAWPRCHWFKDIKTPAT